jgi:MFS family permease
MEDPSPVLADQLQVGQLGYHHGVIGQPQQRDTPVWMVIGPGLGAALAAYEAGAIVGTLPDATRYTMHLNRASILVALAIFVVGLVVGVATGVLVGRRAPTSVAAPALGLILVGNLAMALTPSAPQMIVACLLLGFGGGAVSGTAVAVAIQTGAQRAPVLAALGVVAFLSLVAGFGFARFIETAASWRWAFFPAVLTSLVVLAVTVVCGLVAQRDPRSRMASHGPVSGNWTTPRPPGQFTYPPNVSNPGAPQGWQPPGPSV